MGGSEGWEPDVLGPGFQRRTLPLKPDDEGEVVATLVRYRPDPLTALGRGPADGADVLYVHGWSDYFFQAHLARFWAAAGARFWALDLRKYGRSLRPGQTPGYVTDLAVYDEDIEAALSAIGHGSGRGRSRRRLLLMGHSTGGLTLSLWAARHPGRVAALVLNAPWLEFQTNAVGRQALAPLLQAGARLRPRDTLPNVDLGFYSRTTAHALGGEWDYDPAWRPEHGFRITVGWLNAVLAGHARVQRGLDIAVPVLVVMSARSALAPRWSEDMRAADVALDVDVVAERATRLGPDVTIQRLDGALHDVFLSAAPVRAAAERGIADWLPYALAR